MPAMFSGPPKLPKQPLMAPPENTALTAQLKAMQRRAGSNAATLQQNNSARSSVLTHQLTGQ